MSIVAPVNEIGRCDIFLYFNLYAGEQYNAETGLYYNRARYMDPTTGTFSSMDNYSGSIYDPVSLHKYLYANANPVTYTDPTGYFSFSELMVVQKILILHF